MTRAFFQPHRRKFHLSFLFLGKQLQSFVLRWFVGIHSAGLGWIELYFPNLSYTRFPASFIYHTNVTKHEDHIVEGMICTVDVHLV